MRGSYSRRMPTDTLELAVLDDPVELGAFTRTTAARDGRRIGESCLRIAGMHCAACAPAIESALRGVDGVLDARVSAAAQAATVRWDMARTRASALVQAVRRAGYDAVPDTAAAARALRERERRQMTWRLFVALLCAMQVMMMATPAYVSAPGELAPDLKRLLDWGSWILTVPVLWFSAAPFFGGAWRSLRCGQVGMDVPVALGIAVAFVASTGATYDPGGPFGSEVYFDSLTMFVAFLLVGRWLEMAARHRAARTLEQAFGRLPQQVLRVRADGTVETVSAQRLRPGDRVRVPVGDAFAADGAIVQGSTSVDESLLSGEARPVARQVGDEVIAGSLNVGGPVEMWVTRVGADTRYESIVALMRSAMTQRPSLARSADRWAAPFLWTVLVLAAAAAAAWSFIDPSRAVWVALSVLIVTCPCALSLAAPSALVSAAGACARRGVLLRRLDALETLARVGRLFVDKTGTLTEAQLACTAMHRLAGEWRSDDEVWARAASLGAWSLHPLARALAQSHAAEAQAWQQVSETPGLGVQAQDAHGHVWRLGSASWVGGVTVADAHPQVWLSRDGEPIARFEFDERLRDDVTFALDALRKDGVRVTLLSGDGAMRVAHLGAALGLQASRGALKPEDKLAAIRAAQSYGDVVAMLGDGINDAPVLAQADVSFAMGEGALIARANADAVLLSNSLADLVAARVLAQRTMLVIRQNMVWAAVYNAACVPLALAGWLPPWAAGLGMAGSSLLVVLNSLRLAK